MAWVDDFGSLPDAWSYAPVLFNSWFLLYDLSNWEGHLLNPIYNNNSLLLHFLVNEPNVPKF